MPTPSRISVGSWLISKLRDVEIADIPLYILKGWISGRASTN